MECRDSASIRYFLLYNVLTHMCRAKSHGGPWQPYDLEVVPPQLAHVPEHFVVSAHTVVRMAAGQITDCLSVAEWCVAHPPGCLHRCLRTTHT